MAIAAGSRYNLGLRSDGSIVGWGYDGDGQTTPPDGNDFVATAAGEYHSLALKADGAIVGWGYDDYGQATPPNGTGFVAVAAGSGHSLALMESGPSGLTLTEPNGGENVISGRIYTIEWESSGRVNSVLIEYSDSNGLSWATVSRPMPVTVVVTIGWCRRLILCDVWSESAMPATRMSAM